jgi:type II secretory pathway component PulK
LGPFITTLPEQTDVNINTASAELIAAMLYEQGAPANLKSEAERWVEDAMVNPYPKLEVFAEQLSKNLDIKLPDGLSVSSSYFRAYTQMTFGSVEHRMSTLYQRKGGRARILQQTRTLF